MRVFQSFLVLYLCRSSIVEANQAFLVPASVVCLGQEEEKKPKRTLHSIMCYNKCHASTQHLVVNVPMISPLMRCESWCQMTTLFWKNYSSPPPHWGLLRYSVRFLVLLLTQIKDLCLQRMPGITIVLCQMLIGSEGWLGYLWCYLWTYLLTYWQTRWHSTATASTRL